MKFWISTLFTILGASVFAQNLYDQNTIQTIEITFAESNWDALLDAQKAGDENYILAQSISINGEVFDSVGVKYKGNSTYNANQTKNPFHIELDTYKDHQYGAYTDIKLSNAANDPTFIREVLSYQIIRQYMDAPLSNYANVYVNGTLIGLYSNSESISKKFVNSRFYSKTNAFLKCNPPDGAGPQSNDFPNLEYLGEDSTAYYDAYEIKSDDDYGWDELIDLCDTLSNHLNQIEEILDVDRALWMLAINNVLVNLDSYSGAFSQNYYLYRDDYGRFLPIIWDLNESFGRFSMTGSINLNNTASKQQMTPLLHETDADFPLIEQLLSIPSYKRMYFAHMKTLLLENFDNNSYYETAQVLQSLIDASVQADGNKFFTYNDFLTNLTSDLGGGGGPGGPGGGGNATPGITNLMDGRNDYLLALSYFTEVEPSISNINESNSTPSINETINITASITNENTAYLAYRSKIGAPFTKIEMYDDGLHQDGNAGDGTYGSEIVITSSTTQYYIYAENDNIGKFSPQRAQHEYYEINASFSGSAGDLVINEFMASNDSTASDQDGDFDDWIELYNNSSESIDLEGYFLTDDDSELTQWIFPEGTSIEANSYLIIWADEDDDQEGLHANFKLSASAETILLLNQDTTIVDNISYIDQVTDVSYGRFPNGTGDFQSMTPTFNAENIGITDCETNGGDEDSDGVCADFDCDDNDASVGESQQEGSSCDDGDPATENDVILADGCTCAGISISLSDLVINEFMASNDTTASDQDGDFDDWIELYNNGSEMIDLGGYFLSDDESDFSQWEFPAGTSIEANGYLIIWADEDDDQEGLHANFKLSASAESIFLLNPDTILVDAVTYIDQSTDISYGRYPNGTGNFQSMIPTFNSENTGTTNCESNGGDEDNDGVCADFDCDDNDASVGASQEAGSSCDDEDAGTENDVILADGCSCAGSPLILSDLVINEFMASNDSTASDQDGDFDDWIELYNNGSESINLEGYFLSDDADEHTKWTFPEGSVIEADGYLIIWADEDDDQAGLHASFKLSASQESVLLFNSDTVLVDGVSYTEQTTDVSYGRIPNGTGDFESMTPTFNAENTGTSGVLDFDELTTYLIAFPNPAQNEITISSEEELTMISIYNLSGQKVMEQYPNSNNFIVNTSQIINGMYMIRGLTSENKIVVHKVVIEK